MQPRTFHLLAVCFAFASAAVAGDRIASPTKSGASASSAIFVPTAAGTSVRGDGLEWLDDYGVAMKQADLGRKMLLIYFHSVEPSAVETQFETESLSHPDVAALLRKDYVTLRLPTDYEVSVGGEKSRLIEHDAFSELNKRPGIAIIDFAHPAEEYHGYVVSLLPLANGKYYRFQPSHLQTLLALPQGTLTQRTMIFAVRIHPESPRSTVGEPDRVLFDEAREHSRHQARIRLQGHHNWGQRFQRIVSLLGNGLRPKEVVAESWPNEGLVDAAVDCVDSWRQSSGHWGAVRATQVRYGYDIKRGENGIWYATGLFGDHRP